MGIRKILSQDGRRLFLTRFVRMYAYGALSVVLVLYLSEVGLSGSQFGLLLTLTLIGDTVISLWMTTSADRLGRRRMLVAGALLMLLGGVLFSFTSSFLLLVVGATFGVLSPNGKEVGPFQSIEQAALSQTVDDKNRTKVFAWYNLTGSFAAALGALCAGSLLQVLQEVGFTLLTSYRTLVLCYAVLGAFLGWLFMRLTAAVEASVSRKETRQTQRQRFGLHRSHGVVLKLSGLFAIDAFAGGFIIQSIVAYWFHIRFGVEPALLGSLFFAFNLMAGVSALAAAWLASRIGLINTMFFTHLPSNVLLVLVPLMPNLPLAAALLLLRFSISQMDVPTRQSYTMAVVSPDERSAAAGVTNVVRSLGAAFSPSIAGVLIGSAALLNAPFFLAGGLKIVYDFFLYFSFRKLRPPEEQTVI